MAHASSKAMTNSSFITKLYETFNGTQTHLVFIKRDAPSWVCVCVDGARKMGAEFKAQALLPPGTMFGWRALCHLHSVTWRDDT